MKSAVFRLFILWVFLECHHVQSFVPNIKKSLLKVTPSGIPSLTPERNHNVALLMNSNNVGESNRQGIWRKIWGRVARSFSVMPALVGLLFLSPSLAHARSATKAAEPVAAVKYGRGFRGKQPAEKVDSGSRGANRRGSNDRRLAVIDEDDDEDDEAIQASQEEFQKKLTYIGYGMIAVTIIAAVLSDSSPKASSPQRRRAVSATPRKADTVKPIPPRAPAPVKKAPVASPKIDEDDEEEDDLFAEEPAALAKPTPTTRTAPQTQSGTIPRFNGPLRPNKLPTPPTPPIAVDPPMADAQEDLDALSPSDEEEAAPVSKSPFVSSVPKRKFTPPVPPVEKKVVKEEVKEEEDEDDYVFESPASQVDPVPAPAPAAAKKQGGFLSRLFQKPGGDRDTDLRKVLAAQDTAQPLRSTVASILARYAHPDVFPEYGPEGVAYDPRVESAASGEESKLLQDLAEECSLTKEQAAEAFAQVTSAMLVTLTDLAVEASEKKMDESVVMEYLDDIAVFISSAGGLFGQCYAGVTIEPVQYNGKAKKGSVENLYYQFFKSTSEYDFKKSVEMFTGAVGKEGAEDDVATEAPVKSPEEEEKEALMARRQESMGLLQRALAIKEGKRNSLEQKATKELMMSGLGGGGGGGLGDLMGALTGKGGAPGGMDMKAIEDMMAAAGGGPGGAPGGFPGIPGLGGMDDPTKNMSQEEMMEMTKQSVSELKALLAEGGVTKDMVKEMEKSMGLDFGQFVKMLNNPAAKANAKSLGPEISEMIDMFKELNKIKNS